jgi:hypothetical protein
MLTPAYLLLGLLAVPIILLYMLRLRRRRVTVSSTLLWQHLARDREANAPWQKLHRNWLLLLQLAILALLVLALARPYLPVATLSGGNSVVLLDASASMQAMDGDGAAAATTRFAAAKAEIARQIDNLGGSDRMTLIRAGRIPVVLAPATNDRERLRQALAAAQPEAGTADWQAAFALAAGAAQGYQETQVIVVSDGGLPPTLPPLPAEIHFLPVGRATANLGISALATRRSEDGLLLLAQATNYGEAAAQTLLSVTIDGTLHDSRQLLLAANEHATLTWTLPAGATNIQAELLPADPAQDLLALDNLAFATNQEHAQTRILLISEGNLFLEKLLALLPGVEGFRAAPDNDDLTAEPYDLIVYDSVRVPNPPPAADLLIINPQAPSQAEGPEGDGWLPVTGTFTNTVAVRLSSSPVLQHVDWRTVYVRQAQQVEAPWAQTLIEADGGPLLLSGERDGRRVAIFTFDLQQSNFPLQIAFPVIMANIVEWLNPGQAVAQAGNVAPGEPVELSPGASVTSIRVIRPDGTSWQSEWSTGAQPILFTETTSSGIYEVVVEDATGSREAGQFAVNLFDPTESRIRPVAAIQIGTETVSNTAEATASGQKEVWPWLALLAFLTLLVEWWGHHRGFLWSALKLP